MKDIFMCFLLNLRNHGNIISANMYREGCFSTIEVEKGNATYKITISKEEKKSEVEQND